jgi:hypothetical protein
MCELGRPPWHVGLRRTADSGHASGEGGGRGELEQHSGAGTRLGGGGGEDGSVTPVVSL